MIKHCKPQEAINKVRNQDVRTEKPLNDCMTAHYQTDIDLECIAWQRSMWYDYREVDHLSI